MTIHKFIYPHNNGLPGTYWTVQLVSEFGYVLGTAKRVAFVVVRTFKSGELAEDNLEISRIKNDGPYKGFGCASASARIEIPSHRRAFLENEGWTFLDSQPEYLK